MILSLGESAIKFANEKAKNALIKQRGLALYRVSNGVAHVVAVHE